MFQYEKLTRSAIVTDSTFSVIPEKAASEDVSHAFEEHETDYESWPDAGPQHPTVYGKKDVVAYP